MKPLEYKKETVWYRGKIFDWESIVSFMNSDIREYLHKELAPCSNEEFLNAYLVEVPAFVTEYDGCLYPVNKVFVGNDDDFIELSIKYNLEDCGMSGYYYGLHWYSDTEGRLEVYTH